MPNEWLFITESEARNLMVEAGRPFDPAMWFGISERDVKRLADFFRIDGSASAVEAREALTAAGFTVGHTGGGCMCAENTTALPGHLVSITDPTGCEAPGTMDAQALLGVSRADEEPSYYVDFPTLREALAFVPVLPEPYRSVSVHGYDHFDSPDDFRDKYHGDMHVRLFDAFQNWCDAQAQPLNWESEDATELVRKPSLTPEQRAWLSTWIERNDLVWKGMD